ncbi:dihydropteroate synthase [Kriegella aquimaris]|uniref:Dihydropteroate synthase n=1 Tax=Kriegella aquimaris TaxID=192904 RepID=A0A1G9RMJ2_9FLAO|nr:dihydropteroate synthase [Kriegella aquimaris]SDM23595.1 dihydropteroate synthase [Kriegella aquimaris]
MTINCKGNLIDLSQPKVMGILNITPDSFYDGGKYTKEKNILLQVESMLHEGATFIDVGAYSSRPGATEISEEAETKRIVPVIEALQKEFPESLLSIDTFRSNVAKECLQVGAAMINDISAGMLDENMFDTIAAYQVPYIMMHMRGNPKNMQQQTNYENLLTEILQFFSERIVLARAKQINDLMVDPGFGFAKNIAQNYELLRQLHLFQTFELPILAGLSRKSMIYKILGGSAENALNGTTALNMVALQKGASILRVHDVKEAVECIKLAKALAS